MNLIRCWAALLARQWRNFEGVGAYLSLDRYMDALITEIAEAEQRQRKVPSQSAAALPRNLRRLREAKGWSVAELAKRSGVSQSTIRTMEPTAAYEAGAAMIDPNPCLSTLLAVAAALQVGVEELVRGE